MELLITSKIPIYISRIALIEVAALTKRKIGLVSSEILEFISLKNVSRLGLLREYTLLFLCL